MNDHFVKALHAAQGRSEFVIAVVADIRGFSEFSTRNESPNIAMFIKRFYIQLLTTYFSSASFVKPTGDGLLMLFRFTETNLLDVSTMVIDSCMQCLADFPTLCNDDPMINFDVPRAIGFGIARGTACCLYSGDEILDYSGHLLNLASRLNDLARPAGLVVASNFLLAAIPERHRNEFARSSVYVRSIAEEQPIEVFYLTDVVQIGEERMHPLKTDDWRRVPITELSAKQLSKLAGGVYFLPLPTRAKRDKIIVKAIVDVPAEEGGKPEIFERMIQPLFEYHEEGLTPQVGIHMETIMECAAESNSGARITIEYVPVERAITKPVTESKPE